MTFSGKAQVPTTVLSRHREPCRPCRVFRFAFTPNPTKDESLDSIQQHAIHCISFKASHIGLAIHENPRQTVRLLPHKIVRSQYHCHSEQKNTEHTDQEGFHFRHAPPTQLSLSTDGSSISHHQSSSIINQWSVDIGHRRWRRRRDATTQRSPGIVIVACRQTVVADLSPTCRRHGASSSPCSVCIVYEGYCYKR